MKFFIGLHHPSDCWPFRRCMLSIERLKNRKSDFRVNEWILDSGAFSQITRYANFTISPDQYLRAMERWQSCGNLVAACTQDWMCESFVLEKTRLSIECHQQQTLQNYLYLAKRAPLYVMPILQGFAPSDYIRHLNLYGNSLEHGVWVGVGSICKRNGNPDAIEDILLAIKTKRPDLKLHGFGLKIQALERPTVRGLLESSDSMAWSYAGRKDNFKSNDNDDPRVALRYAAKVEAIITEPVFIQKQLFEWWCE